MYQVIYELNDYVNYDNLRMSTLISFNNRKDAVIEANSVFNELIEDAFNGENYRIEGELTDLGYGANIAIGAKHSIVVYIIER